MLREGGQRTGRKPARSAAPSAAGQSKKAEKDAARNRRMIDLPPDLERELESMAGELGVPVSSLIAWLVDRALQVTPVEVIRAAREPSRSMRFEYILRPPPPRRGAGRGRR